jgi:histidine triad (HIT) family protein
MACVFCQIVDRQSPATIVCENDGYIAFFDIHPDSPGHILLIPKAHAEDAFLLPEADYLKLMQATYTLVNKMKQVFACERIIQKIVGIDVPHIHVHLLPFKSDVATRLTKDEIVKLFQG